MTQQILELDQYDKILVQFSGGKDSLMMLLRLLSLGVDKKKIQLWHQCIDGKGDGLTEHFMDWPSTEGYVKAIAEYFQVPLIWSWRERGFHGELFRENSLTGDVLYQIEGEDHIQRLVTTKGKLNTRRKFPAKSPNLNIRWCSASLKVDPHKRVINAIEEFKGSIEVPRKILVLTGERREESSQRAKYDEVTLHSSNSRRRIVHHWRMIINEKESAIWELMEKFNILPHPAYYLGFPRLSCRACIFFSPDHWATLNEIEPKITRKLHEIEEELGFTIDNKLTLNEMIQLGKSTLSPENSYWVKHALTPWQKAVDSSAWNNRWMLPAGAFGSDGGAI